MDAHDLAGEVRGAGRRAVFMHGGFANREGIDDVFDVFEDLAHVVKVGERGREGSGEIGWTW